MPKVNTFLNLCVPKQISRELSGPPWNNKQMARVKNKNNKYYKQFKQSGYYIHYTGSSK